MLDGAILKSLAELLQRGKAEPDLHRERLAPSAIYDVLYRVSIIAAAFEIHAKVYLFARRIHSTRLKLLQFVAIRPWLLPVIRDWSRTQGYAQQSSFSARQLQRGFLGDDVHTAVVDLLVARNVFHKQECHLISGTNVQVLKDLNAAAEERDLFTDSRNVLRQLVEVRITNAMLEGW